MRIATWNINSVRLRIQNVLRFTKEQNIDILCLQETKTPDEFFPRDELEKIGFKHQYYRGEKSYNGVAIISKFEFRILFIIFFEYSLVVLLNLESALLIFILM